MPYLIIAGGCLACLGWAAVDSWLTSWRRAKRVIEEACQIVRDES